MWIKGKGSLFQYDTSTAAKDALKKVTSINALPVIGRFLDDKVCNVRTTAVEMLGRINDTASLAPLLNVLNDSDYFVRQAALLFLANLGNPVAIEPLLRSYSSEEKKVSLGYCGCN